MSEQSLLRPTCGNCRHWGTQEESGMHRHCNEPDNLRELGDVGGVHALDDPARVARGAAD